MDTITIRAGAVCYTKPDVFVDYWNGTGVFLVKTHPDEDLDELLKQAAHMRKLRRLTNRAEKRRRGE